MANDFCNIPPSDDTQDILNILPPLSGLNKIVNIITKAVNDIKSKYTRKIDEMLQQFPEGTCPTKEQIEQFTITRNNIVEALERLYNKIDKLSSTISGIATFLRVILIPIKVFQILITALNVVQLVAPIIPNPILVKINAGIEVGQDFLDKIRYKADGDPRLVPLVNGIIGANIATKLFANAIRDLICKLDALDVSMLECYTTEVVNEELESLPEDVSEGEIQLLRNSIELGLQNQFTPVPQEIIEFVEESVRAQEESATETSYRGFTFVIEKVPFSSTVDRVRALAQNSQGITLLQTELSFTSTPDILIQELKLLIDRDSLRAE